MTVLVTGGMGYIGSHTCVELLKQGMDVVIVDNLVNSSAEAGRRVEQITDKNVTFYEIDVRDRERLDEVFRRHKIDCVIHFAGLKAVGESVRMPLEYYDNNLNSTIVLVQTMRKHNVKKIIFSSSATVYSGDNPMPLYETSRTGNCTNPYGWTKYVCEQVLRDCVVADPSWSVVLLRYFNPVGAHSSGLIGEDPRGIPNNLMPFISQTAIGRREKLSIFGNDYDTPDGTCRDRLHEPARRRAHLQPRHRQGRERAGDGARLRDGEPPRDPVRVRAAPRGRPAHALFLPGQERRAPALEGAVRHRGHVPRHVELAIQESHGIQPVTEQTTAGDPFWISGGFFVLRQNRREGCVLNQNKAKKKRRARS